MAGEGVVGQMAPRTCITNRVTRGMKASGQVLLGAVSIASLLASAPLQAAEKRVCEPAVRGAVVGDCTVEKKPVSKNLEKSKPADVTGLPFVISVDGDAAAEGGRAVDAERRTDVGLDAVDIQVKFDGLDTKQILSIKALPPKDDSGNVTFRAATNYARFISRGEVRIYKASPDQMFLPVDDLPEEIIELDADGLANWNAGNADLKERSYVLRVYGANGHFDETKAQSFVKRPARVDVLDASIGIGADLTEDMARVRGIPVYGGAVTVFGRNVPAGYVVNVAGAHVAADTENKFLFQQILPPGDHDIDIGLTDENGEGLKFTRQINIPKNDFFYVALADLTIGHRLGSAIESADLSEFERTYTKGRLAFYLKGKIKGKYLLTASADTGEDSIEEMFKGIDSKDPHQLLRRLDPDDYYPIYGDDSTIVEDAPTSGKLYVRLERGKSHIMWGNAKTTISGTEFARNERALYGLHGKYQSEAVTSFGEPKTRIEAYAAEPTTLPQRDDFLGTGGSAYFLKRQDITTGSEQVVIERRDELTGRIVSRLPLTEGTDYTIDYIQGVIILSDPLDSTASSSGPISGGGTGSDELHLVVNYEATPALAKELGKTVGGRAEQWLGEHVRVGATATQETISTERNRKLEADVTLRKSEATSIEFEVAQSEGRGIGQNFSTDGGLTFREEAIAGTPGHKALAYRVKAKADLGEVTGGKISGSADAFYEFREAGFSALDDETLKDTQTFGANMAVDVSETMRLRFGAAGVDSGPESRKYRAKAEIEAEIAENWSLVAGVTWSRFKEPAKQYYNGDRVDIGGRLTYTVNDDTNVYIFGQATVSKTGDRLNNNRIGVGGETALTERLSVGGEVSYGNSGIGGAAVATYKKDADNSYYLGYRLDPDRDLYQESGSTLVGTDSGVIIAGVNARINEWTTAFSESNADLFGKSRKLSQVYGLTFTPDEVWSTSLGMTIGTIHDPYASDFDRKGVSARLGYSTEAVKVSLNGEVRFEDSQDDSRDRETYLLQADASLKTDENWRVLGHVDALISRSDQTDILDGDYVEASIAATYRPIDHDKLNLLFKYTYLYDLPGAQQVNADGNILGPAQKSHILSADATYDINEWLSVGAKYGFRTGVVSTTRAAEDFEKSSVHLGILRADVAIVKNWDLLVEGRVLHAVESKQTNYGFLAAAYRHIGDNMKVGVGYNFGRFSDDLTDLTYDDKGVFLNVIGKF